jgi:hypothetical protein
MNGNDYTRKLALWEILIALVPVPLLLWAFAQGYGPLLALWGLLLFVAVAGVRFLLSLWRLLFT